MTTMTEYDYDDFPGRPKDPDGLDPKKTQEIWEITTPSTVWLWVTDAREGGYRKQRFGAGGNRRVRISIDDRRYNEEQVVDRTPELNPFTNGLLRLISRAVVEDIDTTAHLTDADLVGLLEMRERAIFEEAVQDIAFELPLRRLKALAEDRGTLSQNEFLSDLLIQRFPLPAAGTQPTVQEMIDEEEKATGTRLSGQQPVRFTCGPADDLDVAVLEISASVETDRVDAELTTIQVEAQLAPLSIQAVLDKPKIDLDDPTAV